MISIFIISVVMAALTSFFVSSTKVINRQGGSQVATQLAATATSKVRSMKGSEVVDGRDKSSSDTQWNNPVTGVAPYLVDMVEAWDSTAATGAGATATVPTTAVITAVNNVNYEQRWYVGDCWQPLAGGACGKVTSDVPFFRVVVAVTWPDSTCTQSVCSYVTSTLVSSAPIDPVYTARTIAMPAINNPGDQVGTVSAAVSLQLTSSGGLAPLSWSYSGLPPGVTGNAGTGLISGTLPSTPGTYNVVVTLTDSYAPPASITAAFVWTVLDYPLAVASDFPWAYHRQEDNWFATDNPAVADSSGKSHPGISDGATSNASTRWDLDDGTGTTVTDRSGAVDVGTLGSGATWTNLGHESGAVLLDGTANGYVRGTDPAVDTNAAFSVSAWVYVTGASLPATDVAIVSQPGTKDSGFELNLRSNNKFSFSMATTDTNGAGSSTVTSTASAVVTTWMHVVGVFDPSAAAGSQLKIYVNNGTPNSAAHTSTWNSTGALQIGRVQHSSAWGRYWPGRVAEMRTYRRALSAAHVSDLYTDSPSAVYNFSEPSGATTRDGSGNNLTSTLGAGATFDPAGHIGSAMRFNDSATGTTVGSGPAVTTNASFTISAWVYNDDGSYWRNAVNQAGTRRSAFNLGEHDGVWRFAMSQADTDVAAEDVVTGSAPVYAKTWTHIAGVYDSVAHTITLYINGVAQGSTAHTTTWSAGGGLQIGVARWMNSNNEYWKGMVDEVRAYRRVLTAAEILDLARPPAVTVGIPGALVGHLSADNAIAFAGYTNLYNATPVNNPTTFTIECWFRVAGNRGGTLVTFHKYPTGRASGSNDRSLYMDSGNRLSYALWPGTTVVLRSPAAYNDGSWHYTAASLGAAGTKLYVDGALVASSSNTGADGYTGYWRIGGSPLNNWPNMPLNSFLTGSLDEVAIYDTQLTDAEVLFHYNANK